MLRRKTSTQNPADWFAFAEERLRGADVLWRSEGITALGLEALQESVERYLKGYLIAKGWRLIKTHDLEKLIDDACGFDSEFSKFINLAAQLTEEFFLQHYPGHDTTDLGRDYERLRQESGELISMIHKSLPQYFPKPPA
jgi:HEPN domain-containing protein